VKPLRAWKVVADLGTTSLRIADVQWCAGVPRDERKRTVPLAVEVASGVVYRKGVPSPKSRRR
jgi:hypothetical protein